MDSENDNNYWLERWLKCECKKRLYGKFRPLCIVPYIMYYRCDQCRYYYRNIGKKHIDNEIQFTDEELKLRIKEIHGEDLYKIDE